MNIRLTHTGCISSKEMSAFLCQYFPPAKVRFLEAHGNWWHGGDNNRLVIMVDEQIAAYCAIIPTRIGIAGVVRQAIWWVDLFVAPMFRGLGLQSIFNQEVLKRTEIKICFANELAARIHQKHGWFLREDLNVLMLPLKPFHINKVKRSQGLKKLVYYGLALGLNPWTARHRQRALRFQSMNAREDFNPNADILAGVFERAHTSNECTTYRNWDFFQKRYFNSPLRDQYHFYTHGDPNIPSHYAIMRLLDIQNEKVSRILDLYGDFQDQKSLSTLVNFVVSECVRLGANQVTILVSLPEIQKTLRAAGFILRSKSRFCWFTDHPEVDEALSSSSYWTLADSDNDEPGVRW